MTSHKSYVIKYIIHIKYCLYKDIEICFKTARTLLNYCSVSLEKKITQGSLTRFLLELSVGLHQQMSFVETF